MTDRRTWLSGGIVLAAILASVTLVAPLVAPQPPVRSYSDLLAEAAAGRLVAVTQQGAHLDVEGTDGRYVVQAPSILTNVFDDLQAASDGTPPMFTAIPAPDAAWLSLWPVVAANLALIIALLALAVALQRRRPGQPT